MNGVILLKMMIFIIVVPKIVIREIDRHKDQSRGKIQKRAKSISSKFSKILLDGIKSRYIIETCKDPSKECFEGGDFNKDINDDWFILSALKSGYDIQNIVVISSDNNLLLKAKENGLAYKKMPETYLIKEELSEEEKHQVRIKYTEYINGLNDEVIVSDGHYSFMETVAFTEADGDLYDIFIYLYCSPENLKERYALSEKNAKFADESIESLRQWQEFEINNLREECHRRNKDFLRCK